jgi:hypothetical protein
MCFKTAGEHAKNQKALEGTPVACTLCPETLFSCVRMAAKAPVNFVMSVRLSACIGAAPTWQNSVEFDSAGFHTNLSKNVKFG